MFERLQHWLAQLFQGNAPRGAVRKASPDFRIALVPDRPVREQFEEALHASPRAIQHAGG